VLQARAGAACVGLPDGRALVLGGADGNTSLLSAEIFDPKENTWVAVGNMGVARDIAPL
jgi:sugar (pentulose or hexulose) kinase